MTKPSESLSSKKDTITLQTEYIMEALRTELGRVMKSKMEILNQRIDRITTSQKNRFHVENSETRRRREKGGRDFGDYEFLDTEETRQRGRVKMNIPPFQGKNDPELYLEWERKVEFLFECYNYSELKKVKLAAVEFYDYALTWWDQLVTSRRWNGEQPIQTWKEMKVIMRKRFVPNYYSRELYNKLQNLKQGSRSVDEYYKEMEVALIRANVVEDREDTMARFLDGLNWEIRNGVELHHYVELEDMVHMAMIIENQLKQRRSGSSMRRNQTHLRHQQIANGSPLKSNQLKKEEPSKGDESSVVKPKSDCRGSPSKDNQLEKEEKLKEDELPVVKPRSDSTNSVQRGEMIIQNDGEVEIDNEDEANDLEMPNLIESDEEKIVAPAALTLIAKSALNVQNQVEEVVQRENIFHTRCQVEDKVCSVIIEGGSCTNVASLSMVNKMRLPMLKQPKTYRLQWLNDSGVINVSKQVKVPFRIGKYEDEVLCNVIPMQTSHILLGRPSQFDQKVFEPRDWVWLQKRKEKFPRKRQNEWLHMRDEWFSQKRRLKLLPQGDGHFQMLKRSDALDLRTNPFQEEGNDVNPVPVKVRSNGIIQEVWAEELSKKPIKEIIVFNRIGPRLINLVSMNGLKIEAQLI